MSDTPTYKGYAATSAYDPEDGIFFGRVAGIEDGVGFHADTRSGLLAAFQEAVDDYLATCLLLGKVA